MQYLSWKQRTCICHYKKHGCVYPWIMNVFLFSLLNLKPSQSTGEMCNLKVRKSENRVVERIYRRVQISSVSGGSRIIIRRGFLLSLNNFRLSSQCIHVKNYKGLWRGSMDAAVGGAGGSLSWAQFFQTWTVKLRNKWNKWRWLSWLGHSKCVRTSGIDNSTPVFS